MIKEQLLFPAPMGSSWFVSFFLPISINLVTNSNSSTFNLLQFKLILQSVIVIKHTAISILEAISSS